jgi:hypothetical protein
MMMREIVKVQLPLATNDKKQMALVYNRDRSYMTQIFADQRLIRKMSDMPKRFFWATIPDEGKIVIEEDAPYQDW